MNLGTPELLIILLVVVLLFGGTQLPKLARSLGQAQKEFKKGVGIIAKEMNVPLVPVAITGAYEMLASGKRFPRPSKIQVSFGKPLYPGSMDYDGIVKKLHAEVTALFEENRKK